MRILSASLALLLSSSIPGFTQGIKPTVLTGPSDLHWVPAPPSLGKGAKIAVLFGDPSKPGWYVIRLSMPANFEVPPHHHAKQEILTVLSGSFHSGMGDKLDRKAADGFDPGGFVVLPPGMNHFAWTATATIVQIEGEGPFHIEYATPSDAPSQK